MPPPATASTARSPTRGAFVLLEQPKPRPFDVLDSKLRIPELRPEAVSRTGLVNRLRSERSRLVTVIAAGGYGKTTLLAQWAARDERPFAWLSMDEHDNDPLTLLRDLAAAFEAVEPLDGSVVGPLASPEPSVWTAAAPRLARALAACRRPFVIVIDNVELLRRGEAADLVLALAKNVPEGSVLVLAGRSSPPLPIARLRAAGGLLELGADDLALSRREAQLALLRIRKRFDVELVGELVAKTEGWPAGLHLAALALDTSGGPPDGGFDGSDRYISQYFHSEHLSSLTGTRLAFLRRTSVLERLCGPLCDAILESDGSAAELDRIEHANLFLVPLDRTGGWYRYHGLFRDVLRKELERDEPELAPLLHTRAADWFASAGDLESALHHALEGRDAPRAARLLTAVAPPAYDTGRLGDVERWIERFSATAPLVEYPAVAVLGGWVHALRGRESESKRCLDAAERADPRSKLPDGTSVRSWIALLRSARCAHGVARMHRDARSALAELPPDSPWLPTAHVLDGASTRLSGDHARADACFAAAAEAAGRLGAGSAHAVALAQRSLLAAAGGDYRTAESIALEVRELLAAAPSGGGDSVTGAIAHAATARAFLRHGRWDEARRELGAAERLAGLLTHAIPWLAVETRLALAGAYVTLRDRTAAEAELVEIEKVVAIRRHLGVHAAEIDELRAQIEELPDGRDGRNAGLTGAELRLLPLLATHLSFREIGERLFVSRNTIKTQAISAYRKLGVSSRSAAIERASELGLVDDASPEPAEIIRTG